MRPVLALLFACSLALRLGAAAAAPPDSPDLLLEVKVGPHVLAEALGAYQQGSDIYLPLGELARLLTIAIRSDPHAGQASGYILSEQRGFRLDLARLEVLREARTETVPASLVLARPDDLYVASSLLARWLPADLELDLPSLVLQVRPREKLPLQARLDRLAGARRPGAAEPVERGFPRVAMPYALADTPFIDQTVTLQHRRLDGQHSRALGYAAFASGDLLGMEAALYVSRGSGRGDATTRLSLGRHDPDGGLLGVLQARSVELGSVAAPGLQHLALGSAGATGMLVSNRPLSQPSRFDTHTLHGDLAPGWDVELYYNDGLAGLQQAGADGKYRFADLPLNYGPNEFRLVFHGPLGQLRVERHSFLLEQTLLATGDLHYSISAQRGRDGGRRSQAQFDLGLSRQLSASAVLASLALDDGTRHYASVGLHGFWQGFITTASAVRASGGGRLGELGIKTRLGGLALSASRAWTRDFVSQLYLPGPDLVRRRDDIRVDGVLGGALPLALGLRRDRLASGREQLELGARLSAYRYGTAWSHGLRWQSRDGRKLADAVMQASRRVAGIGLSAQLNYTIEPRAGIASLALSADKHLGDGYLLNGTLTRSFDDGRYRAGVGLNKSLGSFGLGLSVQYGQREGIAAGLQLFMAMGRDPRRARWMRDAAPMAASGSAALQVFLDKNRNGLQDGTDEPIPGAGFLVNGDATLARTDAQGLAYLGRLAPHQWHDIALDPNTLEDPRWQSRQGGVRIVARPGKIGQFDFAVGITGEIDGTTYLLENGVRRGVGDFEVELVDANERIIARATSSSDGYYVMAGIAPGRYRLRLSPDQLTRLGLDPPSARDVQMDDEGNFLNGKDFTVIK